MGGPKLLGLGIVKHAKHFTQSGFDDLRGSAALGFDLTRLQNNVPISSKRKDQHRLRAAPAPK